VRLELNGAAYHVEVYPRRGGGAGEGPALLLLHGFTGSAGTWRPHLPALARWRRCVAPDLLGHGRSEAPADPARYRLEAAVADLAALLDRLGIEQVDVLGYSMGGRLALALATEHPGRVGALILESSSPGIDDPERRARRRAEDEALAALLEREGIGPFVDRWESLPLFASQARLPPGVRAALREQRLAQRPQGLAGSLRGMGQGVQPPLWDRLGRLQLPVLLVAGELDPGYVELARAMAARLPDAELRVVAGAGHAVHLEAPGEFTARVVDFLSRKSPLGGMDRGVPVEEGA